MGSLSMKLTIKRTQESKSYDESFELDLLKVTTLLEALYEIKASLDPTLSFDSGCRSGVCGACSVRVNGKEKLACSYQVQDGDIIEPLNYHSILRDLKVDKEDVQRKLKSTLPFASKSESKPLTPKEEESFRLQSDCILCNSCYSACPVLAVNPNFLGPFALTRALRYQNDPRVELKPSLENIQENGIWDCTLCGECSAVCPQNIDPKGDIMQLRGQSLKAGFNDPNFTTQSFGTPDFGGGFGFGGGF